MKTKYIVLLLIAIFWNCKQKAEKATEPTVEEVEEIQQIPSEIFEIAEFAEVALRDSAQVNDQILFFTIDKNESIDSVDVFQAINIYKKQVKSGDGDIYPIFEFKESGDVVLIVKGRGYGGNIRGTLLIDQNFLEIKKVKFDHKAESEGYGDAMSYSSFENQFVGGKVNFERNTFGLNQNGSNIITGDKVVDGLSGATETSRSAIEMINEELKKYEKYFDANQPSP